MFFSKLVNIINVKKEQFNGKGSDASGASDKDVDDKKNVRVCPDKGPWNAVEYAPGIVALESGDPQYNVVLQLSGDFSSRAHQLAYAESLASWINHHLPPPEVLAVPEVAVEPPAPLEPSLQPPVEPKAETTDNAQEKRNSFKGAASKFKDKKKPPVKSASAPGAEKNEAPRQEPQISTGVAAKASVPAERQKEPVLESAPTLTSSDAHREPAETPVVFIPQVQVTDAPNQDQPCGCHFELPEGQAPDDCVIDHNQREACCYALEGIDKKDCYYWRPLQFVPLIRTSKS